jgi:hypothetical protein
MCQEDPGATNQLRSDRSGESAVLALCDRNADDAARCGSTQGFCDTVWLPNGQWRCEMGGRWQNLQTDLNMYDLQIENQQNAGGGGGGPGGGGGGAGGPGAPCDPGWQPVPDTVMGDGNLGTDCRECPFPDRCDGNGCAEGSGGAGCAYCDNGANGTTQHYQSGSKCKPCPETQASNVILAVIGIAVGAALCAYVWKVSTVAIPAVDGDGGATTAEDGTATDEAIGTKGDAQTETEAAKKEEDEEDDEEEDAASKRKKEARKKAQKAAQQLAPAAAGVAGVMTQLSPSQAAESVPEPDAVAEASRGAVATMSSTAVVAGIALPSIFKISFTYSLPSIGAQKRLCLSHFLTPKGIGLPRQARDKRRTS